MRLDAGMVVFTIEVRSRKILDIIALQRSSGMLSTPSKGGSDTQWLLSEQGLIKFKNSWDYGSQWSAIGGYLVY